VDVNTPGIARLRDLRLVIGLVALAAVGVLVAGGIAVARDDQAAPAGGVSVSCPDVVGVLPEVPQAAVEDVAGELAALESQISEANERLVSSQGEGGPSFVDNAILGPLADKRFATLERIEISIGRHGERPRGLTELAECGLS
jgi:hypothetical protein